MAQDFYDLNAEPVAQAERKPLIGDDRRLMIFAFGLGAILIVWKIVMGHVAHILWDEAHFVVSGQHLDLAYPDIPAAIHGWRGSRPRCSAGRSRPCGSSPC
ncbi:MAG: hypothetical protein WDN06_10470 [Asticcacaulis sp.]